MTDEMKRVVELAEAIKRAAEDSRYYSAMNCAKEIILQCRIAIKEATGWTQK